MLNVDMGVINAVEKRQEEEEIVIFASLVSDLRPRILTYFVFEKYLFNFTGCLINENSKMENFLFLRSTLSNALEDSYIKKLLQCILTSVTVSNWRVLQ